MRRYRRGKIIIMTPVLKIATGKITLENASTQMIGRPKRLSSSSAIALKMMLKGKTYFRVRCGKFSDEKEARDYHRKLTEKEGLHGFILKIGE